VYIRNAHNEKGVTTCNGRGKPWGLLLVQSPNIKILLEITSILNNRRVKMKKLIFILCICILSVACATNARAQDINKNESIVIEKASADYYLIRNIGEDNYVCNGMEELIQKIKRIYYSHLTISNDTTGDLSIPYWDNIIIDPTSIK